MPLVYRMTFNIFTYFVSHHHNNNNRNQSLECKAKKIWTVLYTFAQGKIQRLMSFLECHIPIYSCKVKLPSLSCQVLLYTV